MFQTLVDDFFKGPITRSWNKLEPYVIGERQEQGRETSEEWFEWLTHQLRKTVDVGKSYQSVFVA